MVEETPKTRNVIEQIMDAWNSMTQTRQITVGTGALIAVIGLGTLLSSGALQSEWVPLTRGLSPEDQKVAAQALESKSIPYQLGDLGTIEVNPDHLHDARLELAVSSMPSGRNIGFELFDKTELGRSAFAEKVNFHRALEGELERTIRHLDPVERARVHLVMPERALFEEQQATPTSSVVVTLRQGRNLSKGQVKAIRHMVAAAVERLNPGQVAVIDETGAMLARPEDEDSGIEGAIEQQTQMERSIEKRIVQLLEPLVGVGGVRAQVNARMDFSRLLETEEKFDPDSQVARSEREQTEETQSETAPSEGAVGAVNNIPERAPGPGGMTKNNTANRNDRVINYELDRVTKRRESPTPRLTRLSVAVIVDGARELNEDGDLKVRPRTAEEVEGYRNIVSKAVGYDENRGDQLELTYMPFVRPAHVKEKPVEPTEVLGMAPWMWGLIAVTTVSLIGGLFIFLSIRRKRRMEAEEAARLAALYGESEDDFSAEPTLGEKVENERRQAADMTRHDVQPTANAIRAWLSGGMEPV